MRSRTVFCFFGAFALTLLFAGDCLACQCVSALHGESVGDRIRTEIARSKAIFVGKVVEIVGDSGDDSYIPVEFSVTGVWKGRVTRNQVVLTGIHDGNCRFPFAVGRTYLVYTSALNDGSLLTGICERTQLISKAGRDSRYLGKARKPQQN